jgi:PAS domain-containing protein
MYTHINGPHGRVPGALRESELRFRQLAEHIHLAWAIEQADDGYVILEVGDRIASAHPRAWLYLGLPHDPQLPIPGTFLGWA